MRHLMDFHILAVEEAPKQPVNPCVPSPCGPNSECNDRGETPACSCAQNYIGVPPNCRPECTINPECASHLACIQQRCRDPCAGLCGIGARCSVVNHHAVCSCAEGFTGDPFSNCIPAPKGKWQTFISNFLMHALVLLGDGI